MKTRTYDCQHKSVNSLEKELLYEEVMRLRLLIANAESLLHDILNHTELDDISDETEAKITKFLS